jgi:imidazolonepropionase-like amidohydrolase
MMQFRRWIVGMSVGIVLGAVTVAGAQTPRAEPEKAATVLRAGRMLDVRRGRLVENVVILVRGETIEAVGPAGQVRVPADARVIDLSRATVLPGLIDMHTHLTGEPRYIGYSALGLSVPRQALIGAKNARLTLMAGFTTVRNVGASGYTDVALRDAIEAGDLPGPRMVVSGPALGITGGHCDESLLPPEYRHRAEGVADGPAAVLQKVREVIKYGADVIKVCATGGVLSKGDNPEAYEFNEDELRVIVQEAHKLGRKVAAHAHGLAGILLAVRVGVDSIEHGSFIDDEAVRLMKEKGVYLVPTLYLADWFMENAPKLQVPPFIMEKARKVMPAARQNIRRAFQMGVPVAFGTDAAVYPHGLNAREFAVMVRLGLTPLQAIQAATLHAAELLGWSDRIGTLEPGKFADIIAVEGNPLEDVTVLERVRFVMKGGEVYRNDFGGRLEAGATERPARE